MTPMQNRIDHLGHDDGAIVVVLGHVLEALHVIATVTRTAAPLKCLKEKPPAKELPVPAAFGSASCTMLVPSLLSPYPRHARCRVAYVGVYPLCPQVYLMLWGGVEVRHRAC
jgi:hypothetical protein